MNAKYPVLHPQVAMQSVDGLAVIVLADSGEVIVVNEIGSRIVELIDGKRSAEEVAVTIESEFTVTAEEARSDLEAFMQMLAEAGALRFDSR
ncbi:MAG TPA: PqqD family protein [Blastocatellia bacterium]|nr:PqqD family protein [Blastocatellia bacterium]